jgi:uncharacterized protein YdiU (UPF0061 family)
MPRWRSALIEATVGDEVTGGGPRQVPGACWSRCKAEAMPDPVLRLWNETLADELGGLSNDSALWTGSRTETGMQQHAHRYGGHQFGTWVGQLGDGRALSLGHVEGACGWTEVQLKGAGRTPYSRQGDGRAVLRSSLREYLCSEAMHHLRVPTSRALSLCTTGESVPRDMFYDGRPAMEQGAIVARTAPSFLRFGSFQILASDGDDVALRGLIAHVIEAHEPDVTMEGGSDAAIVHWLTLVAQRTARMVSGWMQHGFVHGVMNTDNMSIHGVTIDYGPFGWLEAHDPTWTPNTTDLPGRRYRFAAQPSIAAWNLARLLDAVAPVMQDASRLERVMAAFSSSYGQARNVAWAERLGLRTWTEGDEGLVREFQHVLHEHQMDGVRTMRTMADGATTVVDLIKGDCIYGPTSGLGTLEAWMQAWLERCSGAPDTETMQRRVPVFRVRNWVLQLAIDAAEAGDWSKAEALSQRLKHPFDHRPEDENAWWSGPRPAWAMTRPGCSMLSCSS